MNLYTLSQASLVSQETTLTMSKVLLFEKKGKTNMAIGWKIMAIQPK